MKQWIKTLIVMAALIIIYFFAQNCITYYHESVHQTIYASYNISSYVTIDYLFGGGKTYAEEACPMNSECENLHNWNEIVTYNMSAFVFNLWCMLWFYLIWQWAANEKKKK
jgi:hypothetical protein